MPLFGRTHPHTTHAPPPATWTGTGTNRDDTYYDNAGGRFDDRTTDRTTGPDYGTHNAPSAPREYGEYGRGGAGAAGVGPAHNNLETEYPQDAGDRGAGLHTEPPYNQSTRHGGGYDTNAPYDPSARHGGAYNTDVRYDQPHQQGAGYTSGPATNAAGVGTGMGAGTGALNAAVSPTLREARRKERNGKLEHAAGILLSSQSMKAKGLAKEEEGRRLKIHGQETARAEALEREAAISRNRADAAIGPATGGGVRNDLFGGPRQPII